MSCVTHFALVCTCIQLFRERLSTKMCTRQSRKVIWNVGQYIVPGVLSCRTYFCCFRLILANRRPRPLVPFLHISSKNSELETTHNHFRDCSVHPFPTTFLEIAVWTSYRYKCEYLSSIHQFNLLKTFC